MYRGSPHALTPARTPRAAGQGPICPLPKQEIPPHAQLRIASLAALLALPGCGLTQTLATTLPDAPLPAADLLVSPENPAPTTRPVSLPTTPVALKDCPYDQTHAHECRVHWRQLLISSAVFLTWQNTANLYSSYWYRYETTHGNWFDRYATSVTGYKYSVWSDGPPRLDDYIAHPMMGGITNAL
ncbi:MAG TPA: hypothetical protein VNW54_03885 [Granulicella sp.]|nr:hypothetical protein [Granulicella sp.]